MDIPSIAPRPEIRGPLISLLTQLYTGLAGGPSPDVPAELTEGASVTVPDTEAGMMDLLLMFLAYVRETEAEHGGDFLEFLRRQAEEPFLAGDDAAGS